MPNELTIDDLPILRSKHVYIKNEKKVINDINKMVKDGANKLQIVSDFDLTLTKQHVDGKQILSSFGMFGKCKSLPSMYKEESKRLYDKYRPIEIDPNLSVEEKSEAMMEWMVAAHHLLRGLEFNPRELDDVIRVYGTALRDGTKGLIRKLNEEQVPVLVFSAGLGDVVEAVLRHHDVLLDNVKVISNFLKYDGGRLDGLKGRLIHVFNKNEHAVGQDYFKILEGRCNVLLMGDTTGDATMADGVDTNVVLKIGFLYDNVAETLPSYMEAFDIVLVDDQTMRVPSEILKHVL